MEQNRFFNKWNLNCFIYIMLLLININSNAQNKLDFTSIKQFWKIHEILIQNKFPTENNWDSLFKSPGYFYLNQNKLVKRSLELAYLPSLKAERDSIARVNEFWQSVLQHLFEITANHAEIDSFEAKVLEAGFIANSVQKAQDFLPNMLTANYPPPVIYFAIFQPDGFALENTIIIDAHFAADLGITAFSEFVAHEIHHYYVYKISKLKTVDDDPYADLIHSINQLQLEGIADLIDKKQYPIILQASRGKYAKAYNGLYERVDSVFRIIDKLISQINNDTSKAKILCNQIRKALPLGAHPFGFYMANAILKISGKDGLIATIGNPFLFFRTYNEASKKDKTYFRFSQQAINFIAELEKKYIK